MWWPDPARKMRTLCVAAAIPLALAACNIRPLYGDAPSGGMVQEKMAAIAIDEVPDRIGHYLVEDLRFDLNGAGKPVTPRYRLSLTVSESVSSAIVSSVTGRAVSANINATTDFKLTAVGSGETVLTGRVAGSASYDRTEQRFAAVRAARDAEIRVARTMSDLIRTRIAAHFATKP